MDNIDQCFSTGLASGVLLEHKSQSKNEMYVPILQKSTMPSCTVHQTYGSEHSSWESVQ